MSGPPHKELVPKEDQGWYIPSCYVKVLDFDNEKYSVSCRTEYSGKRSLWHLTKADDSKSKSKRLVPNLSYVIPQQKIQIHKIWYKSLSPNFHNW